MDIMAAKILTSENVIHTDVDDELILLHLDNGDYYGLDPLGKRIWSLLKDHKDQDHICRVIMDEYDVDQETIRQDVQNFLSDLHKHSIVINA